MPRQEFRHERLWIWCRRWLHVYWGTGHKPVSFKYSLVPFLRCQFSQKYSQRIPHSSPVRARYGMSFEDPASDWYSAWVPVQSFVRYFSILDHVITTLYCINLLSGMRIFRFVKDFRYFACGKTHEIHLKKNSLLVWKILAHSGFPDVFLSDYSYACIIHYTSIKRPLKHTASQNK